MESVKLYIPGDPKPMQRPRQGINRKTQKPIFFIPAPTLEYQQKVRTAAMQPANLPWLMRFLSSDPYHRLTVDVQLTFCRHRYPDPVNVVTNIYDGLVRALGGNDKGYTGTLHPATVDQSLEEGFTEITIRPFKKETADEPII